MKPENGILLCLLSIMLSLGTGYLEYSSGYIIGAIIFGGCSIIFGLLTYLYIREINRKTET